MIPRKDLVERRRVAPHLELFPLFRHLRSYRLPQFRGDFMAGLNVGLLAFPQGMAYALIAGLPIEYGLYGSAVAGILGGCFSGSRFITLGPTNATSVMLATSFGAIGIVGAAASAALLPMFLLLVGAMLLVGALLKLADVTQYISQTVVTGYVTAAALLIVVGQVPDMLGLDLGEGGRTFATKLWATLRAIPTADLVPVLVAGLTAGTYYGLGLVAPLRRLPRVAITLVGVTLLVVGLTAAAEQGFGLSGVDWPGLRAEDWQGLERLSGVNARNWPVTWPSIDWEALRQLANPAIAVALLCVLEGTSIGKSLAARSGERLNADQEMYAIGITNLGSAFFGGMPASGSLTRSKVSWSSGSRTPVTSLISGVLVGGGVFLIGPYLAAIPMAVLATLVVIIGISLIDRRAITVVTASTGSDRLVFWVTLSCGLLLALDTAIYVGAGLSILLFLRKASSPELVEYSFSEAGDLREKTGASQRALPEVSIIHAEGDLFFGATDMFRDQMRRVSDEPNLKIVICKLRNARHLDATTVMAIEELVKYMNAEGRYLILSEVRPSVMRVLEQSRLLKFLNGPNGEPFVFADTPGNPTLSTAQALRRAQELIGYRDANVSIYVKPKPPAEPTPAISPTQPPPPPSPGS